MFKNYFATAINNLFKNKLYSAINIVGLAIGLAACVVMALYVQEENSYDKQWDNSDRIYRMNTAFDIPGGELLKFPLVAVPAIPGVRQYFANEIEFATRTMGNERIISIGDVEYEDTLVNVDPDFLEMFQVEVLAGSLKDTLSSPSNIALSEEVATRYYGSNDPIGEVLTATIQGYSQDYQVTAIYSLEGNTVLDIPMMSLLDDVSLPEILMSWFSVNSGGYFQLRNGIGIEAIESRIGELINQNVDLSIIIPDVEIDSSEVVLIDFQNMETLHLDSPWDTLRAGGNKTVVLAFSAIAVLVLLIGGINFTILTTAKATQRAREVAMRKVLGARRKQLVVQFLGESFFIVMLAMALSLLVVEAMLPLFEAIVGKELSVDYTSPFTYISLTVLLFIVGLSGGLYPAFILSGFRPGSILKSNRSSENKGSASLRSVLVVFQFTVSIALIIATSIIYAQIQYSSNRDPGFNKENVLVINQLAARPELQDKVETLKQQLLGLANVSDVGLSSVQPSQQQQNYNVYTTLGESSNTYTLARTGVGYDYFKTYQIPFVAGRDYTLERDTPEPEFDVATATLGNSNSELLERNIILNVGAVKAMGFASAEAAIGQIINSSTLANINYTIIGVIADNHIYSINSLPRAELYLLEPTQPNVVSVRFQGSPQAIVEQASTIWKDVMGDVEISTVFVNQLLANEFTQAKTEANMLISFSLLAVLIACLGLYGSASFTVDRRTKEIGLRKVMGAKVKNIVALLLWQFSKPVIIANIIAWPIAVWVMLDWLQRFPYQLDKWILFPICLAAGIFALSISWLTVASNTTRVARGNPINALRYE